MAKKWGKPCNVCKGELKIPCTICGWKKWGRPCLVCNGKSVEPCVICLWKSDKVQQEADEHELVGHRERVDYLHKLLTYRTNALNPQCLDVSATMNGHHEWIHRIYLRFTVGQESLSKLVSETQTTEKTLKLLLSSYGAWLRRTNRLHETMMFVMTLYRAYLSGKSDFQIEKEFNMPLSVVIGSQRHNAVTSV